MNAAAIQTRTNSRGHKVRLQRRNGKYDVLYNSNGYTWTYKAKSVAECIALNVFELESM